MSESALSGLKPVHLELGGKSPQVVFDDIEDIDATVSKIAAGMYVNSGQVCTSGTRLIAHKKIVNELVDRLIDIGSQKTWTNVG